MKKNLSKYKPFAVVHSDNQAYAAQKKPLSNSYSHVLSRIAVLQNFENT